jgi:CBS domain-containing protein
MGGNQAMPTSFQAPMRRDKVSKRTDSQTKQTNMAAGQTSVAQVIGSKGSSVISIRPQDTLGRAVEVLRDKRIGALLVTDATGALVGILSERDIVRKLADMPGQTLPQKVEDAMTATVETCAPDEAVVSVLKRMTAGRFRHMPVMDGDALIGMVTIGDVVNYRLNELEHEALQLKQLVVG